jgi:hypothetical protein
MVAAVAAALVWWMGFGPGVAAEPGPGLETMCLLIEPRDGLGVAKPISGARSTVVVAGRETRLGGVRVLSRAEFEGLGMSWAAYERKAAEAADRVFATLKPEVTRDAKGFARFAVVKGKSHLTASTVLAPKFYAAFRQTMGDDLVVLIPDRFTVYVFPRPMGEYKDWGKRILREYAEATYPVSVEVLLLNRGGLSALGSFQTE